MTKNKIFPTIIFIIVLVGLPLLTACQSISPKQALAAEAVDLVDAEFDYEQAAENTAFRWVAMAEAYQRNGMLNYSSNPDDVSAFRWNAIADGYERLGLLNVHTDPAEVSAFRWNAIAQGYKQHGMLNYASNPDDVSTFRWLAMAKAYEKMGMLNHK